MEHLTREKKGNKHLDQLPNFLKVAMLPTPMQPGNGGTNGKAKAKEIYGSNSQLNPRFVAEMMGFPPDWTELPFLSTETNLSKPMETQ